ncbi:MAG TPA: ATP-binding protein [Chryseosolibacter sp.]
MNDKVIELIKYGSESHALDFKEVQYPIEAHDKKNEILKDISAMANHPSNEEKYIIIGVKELNGTAAGFRTIDQLFDEAKYQQFVKSNIDPQVNFEYKTIAFEGFRLAFFRIYNNVNRPYLFKKDLNNPLTSSKNEYRVGDGYIRQGTSTRKIAREDLEMIYKARYASKDRKGELKVTPGIFKSEDDEVGSYDLSCLDFTIENNSPRSIELDIEIKIVKNKKFTLIQECELKKEIERKRNEARKAKDSYSIIFTPNANFSFDVSMTETESNYLVTRDKRRGERTAIAIPQHDKEPTAFCRELLILCDTAVTIGGEMTIRSDDFSDGAWILPFAIEYKP